MNILILGGVAAGTKTAAKLKREDRSLNVTILTKDKDISYAGCGLPYYVGGLIENREELIVNTSIEKLVSYIPVWRCSPVGRPYPWTARPKPSWSVVRTLGKKKSIPMTGW